MMWGYGESLAGLWMLPVMVLVPVGVIALVFWMVRAPASRGIGDPAIATLRRRLAAGEISQDEFEKTRRILEG